jgi:opacity protein-like surface antigen
MMRKILIAATMAAVCLAVPAMASATVSVDANGVGSIGKGDVQTALGYHNDAEFQADAALGKITFSNGTDTTTSYAYVMCGDFNTPAHPGVSYPADQIPVNVVTGITTTTRTPNVTVLKNNGGKVTGYTLNGVTSTTTTQTGTAWYAGCPAGMGFARWQDPSHAFGTVVVNGGTGLTVSNGVNTVALPNTVS